MLAYAKSIKHHAVDSRLSLISRQSEVRELREQTIEEHVEREGLRSTRNCRGGDGNRREHERQREKKGRES